MKKHLLSTILIGLFATCFAQRNEPFVISGEWQRGNATEITLYQVIYGRLEKVSVALLQDDRSFAMAYAPHSEGFFVIGTGAPHLRVDKYAFYMKAGDRLNLIVNDTNYTLVGQNTRENTAMKDWHDFIQPLEWQSFYFTRPRGGTSYVQFFPLLEEKLENPYTAARTGNRVFDENFAKYRNFDFIHCAVNFTITPRTAQPENDEFPDFYRELDAAKFDNTDILIFPYNRLLQNIMSLQVKLKGETLRDNPNLKLMEILTNDTLKGEVFLTGILANVRELQRMQDMNARFAKYVVTDDQKKRFNQDIERVNKLYIEQGIDKPGLDWTYKDQNGKEVSFSDFKGKVVYVDVWATWCGPCRAEIPHKKRLKEQFAGNKNIEFVSISTDAPRDLQKWKDFIVANELTGIQLHGNISGPTNISTLYGITGIPRFLLFDKNGNIVSIEAPRPSSAEILPLLTRLAAAR